MSWQAFGARLARAGVLARPLPAARSEAGLPGLVALLTGLGAWLGAAFLLAALSALSLGWLESPGGRIVVGGAICIACAGWMRGRAPNAFMAQFLTACAVAGTLLAASAALDAPHASHLLPWTTAGAAAAMLVANPEPVSRLVMAILMVLALAVAALQWALMPLACVLLGCASAVLWLKQGSWSARGWGGLLVPLAASCSAALVLLPAFAGGGEASLSGLFVTEGRTDLARGLAAWQGRWLAPVGLAIVLAASIIVIRHPRRHGAGDRRQLTDRDAAISLVAAALALACWRAPGILACLLAWLLGVAAARRSVAWLGLAGLVPYLFQLYYSLEATLLAKGAALLATGVLLLVLLYLLRRLPLPAADPQADVHLPLGSDVALREPAIEAGSRGTREDGPDGDPDAAGGKAGTSGANGGKGAKDGKEGKGGRGGKGAMGLALAGALIVFLVFNGSILRKEQLLREGQVVRLTLAPVDPRAFMTGDYMALDYAVAAQLNTRLATAGKLAARDAFAVVAPDSQGVAQLVRLQERASPLQAGEIVLKARVRKGRVRLGSDAFYFREGTGQRYEKARYGEFRVGTDGEMVLVRLLDESLTALAAN